MGIGSFAGTIAATAIGTKIATVMNERDQKRAVKSWEQAGDFDDVTVTITITARKRWIKQLLGLFRDMQTLGSMGSSRMLGFYSDGDGDFRPKFDVNGSGLWNKEFGRWTQWGQEAAEGHKPEGRDIDIERFYDAG